MPTVLPLSLPFNGTIMVIQDRNVIGTATLQSQMVEIRVTPAKVLIIIFLMFNLCLTTI